MAEARLRQERKTWRKDHPIGFWARPSTLGDSTNIFTWKAGIPGKAGTDWEGGVYTVKLQFGANFPSEPPKCSFEPPLFHPNVYSNGEICLSLIGSDWRPGIQLKQILIGIQELLDEPNNSDAAQTAAHALYGGDRQAYKRRVRQEAQKFRPS